MNAPEQNIKSQSSAPHPVFGYRDFKLGSFEFRRDEYFAHIGWPNGSHTMDIGNFLRALMRDVAWGFFYGGVNFDHVFGTTNHYKTVDLYAGTLQRDDEGRRRRPAGELPDRADRRHLRADARRLDQRRLRPVRRAAGNRLALRPQERQQHAPRSRGARELAKRCVGLKDDLNAAHRCARRAGQPRLRRRAAGPARAAPRARLRERGARVQPVRASCRARR